MKKRKILTVIVIIFMLIVMVFWRKTNMVIADSGFDFDYDSGGFDSGGFSSDFDYDYGGGYYGGSRGASTLEDHIISFVIVVVIFGLSFLVIRIQSKTISNGIQQNVRQNIAVKPSISEEQIRKTLPGFDKNEFFKEAFTIYQNVQNAWMNFEMEKVRDQLTDELYNMYLSQVETLKIKGQQNIMKDFKLTNARVTGFYVENDTVQMITSMTIEFYDYIIDVASGKVLRGNSQRKCCVEYEMTFIQSLKQKQTKITCPNCGAPVNINASNKCSYCASTIVQENAKWVLSKKKNIAQR